MCTDVLLFTEILLFNCFTWQQFNRKVFITEPLDYRIDISKKKKKRSYLETPESNK